MSINVTVHGNPISIKRGKMVTADHDTEFDRRRKIRLQQVREQSKEIAADVRNRVRKEKERQLTKAEKQGEEDLKRYQARKLHNLQKQLECTTNEIGAAHRNADEEKEPNKVINERQAKYNKKAARRGLNATQKQHHQSRQQKEEEERGIQRQKYVRNVENLRSSLVAQIDKKASPDRKRKRKKNHTDITITSNIVDDSDNSDVFQSDIENTIQNATQSEYTASSPDNSPQKLKHKKMQQQSSSPEYSTSPVQVRDSNRNRKHKPQNTQRIRDFSPPTESPPKEVNSPTKPPWMRKKQEPKPPTTYQQKRAPEKQTTKRPERRIPIDEKSKQHSEKRNPKDYTYSKKKIAKPSEKPSPEKKSPQRFYTIPSCDEMEKEVQKSPKHSPKQDRFVKKLTPIEDISSESNKSDESGICRCEDSILDSPQVGSDSTRIKKLIAEHRPVDSYRHSTKISDRIRQRLSEQVVCPEHGFTEHQHLDEDHYHDARELHNFQNNLPENNYYPYQGDLALGKNKNTYQATKGVQTSERYNPKPVPEVKRTVTQEVQTTDRVLDKRIVQNKRTLQEPQKTKPAVENRRAPVTVHQEATDRLKNRTSPQKKNQLSPQEIQSTERFKAKLSTKPKLQMETIQMCDIDCVNNQNDTTEVNNLPYVHTTTIKTGTQKTTKTDKGRVETQASMARYFDRLNHFTKDYRPQPIVEKMTKDSIEVHPASARSERTDHLSVMKEQDKKAHERGVKALEKEKIQQDYRQLMEDLPVLQRQERLAAMKNHDPIYHMSDERLQDLERRRQNKIEQIFEKYYNRAKTLEAPLITIRPVQKTPPSDDMRLPFKALDVTDVQLNVAEWKVGENIQDKMLLLNTKDDSEAVQTKEIYKRLPNLTNKNSGQSTEITGEKSDMSREKYIQEKQKSLTEMLHRVNKQRELLLQEVATLPASSNLQKILADEEILKIAAEDKKMLTEGSKYSEEQKSLSNKSSKSFEEFKKYVSTATSPVAVMTPSKKEGKKREKASSSSDSAEESRSKKKLKKKNKKVLIKNIETQTSPTIHSKNASPKKQSDNISLSSKSYKESSSDKVCEIIIKMPDDAEIQINTDSVTNSREICTAASAEPNVKQAQIASIVSARERRKIASLNGNDVSSSTAYLSPPEIRVPPLKECTGDSEQQRMYKDILHKKPQQTNRVNRNEITPCLLNYIKKLLSMSRRSIDDLTVSSVSDVASPGASIIETAENNPLMQLRNVMNYYNLDFATIQQHFTLSDSSSTSLVNDQSPVVEIIIESQPGPSKSQPISTSSEENSSHQRPTTKEIQPSERSTSERALDQPDNLDLPYIEILNKYQELTKNCCEKITSLNAMIDKVRLEKERLISPALSDRNEISTTSYLELPKQRKSSDKKSSDDMEEQQNDKSPIDDKQFKEKSSTDTDSNTVIVNQVLENYLLTVSPTVSVNINPESIEQPDFVPMLQGIPKYNLQSEKKSQPIHLLDSPVKQFLVNSKIRPPPALSNNMQRYSNLNIDMTPHELSTIAEMDTVASSKNASEMLPSKHQSQQFISEDNEYVNIQEKDLSSSSEFHTITPERFLVMESQKESHKFALKSSSQSPKKSTLKKSPKHKATDRATTSQISGVQPLGSDRTSSSTSSPEDMEKILRSMGLGWAVSTLKKTHEALALSSTSTSSVEASFKKRVSFKEYSSSNSEVSLKDVITKEFFKKLSSSSSSSTDISPHLQEHNPNLSEIIGGRAGTQSRDRSQHRTSTPVQQSKSPDSKSNNLFTGESDVSSVRHSQENLFLSIPNISLDTNRTLDKSNK